MSPDSEGTAARLVSFKLIVSPFRGGGLHLGDCGSSEEEGQRACFPRKAVVKIPFTRLREDGHVARRFGVGRDHAL